MLTALRPDDRTRVEAIARLCGGRVRAEFDADGRCRALDFTDPADVAQSTIRYLSRSEKHELVARVAGLDGLQRLNLRRALIGPLPVGLDGLGQLEWLDLGSNDLGTVPESLRGLTRLSYLNLGTNKLTEIPDWLGALQALDDLKLHKNPFHALPDTLAALPRLRALNLFLNRMKRVPPWLYTMGTLENLVLWNARDLSDEIARLQNLVWFTAMGCQVLRHLPEGLCHLPRLRGMRLHQNRLTALPEDVGRLTTLEQVSLYQNALCALPESFGALDRLWRVNLGWNRFERFPEALARLPRLQWLGLYLNPGTETWRGRTLATGRTPVLDRPFSDFDGAETPAPAAPAAAMEGRPT